MSLQENPVVPPYTFHSRAKGYSLIDIIAVSRTMQRKEYESQPLEHITLTGKEDHLTSCMLTEIPQKGMQTQASHTHIDIQFRRT